MEKQKPKEKIGIFLAIIVVLFALSPQMRDILTLPPQKKLLVGEEIKLPLRAPVEIQNYLSYQLNDHKNVLSTQQTKILGPMTIKATNPGQAEVELKLFGTLPIKHITFDVMPQIKVVPSGESIGILLKTVGVTVVGYAPVMGTDGKQYFPAKAAGLKIGDHILKINGQKVDKDEQAAQIINSIGKDGQKLTLEILQNGEHKTVKLIPIFAKDTESYRVGLYIRDSTAGIGTMTFLEPKSQKYGALGHLITDGGNNIQNFSGSKIVRTFVQSIKKGVRGEPGEKVGVFTDDTSFNGNIEENTKYGIFGTLNIPPVQQNYAIPIALASEVREGQAHILTVLHGNEIQSFKIEILRVMPNNREAGKGMVIKIVDPVLLEATGGIIQGMSGSPIIQNGKLVGAVTHVFVNDPTRGYGVMAEWMLQEAGLIKMNAYFSVKKFTKAA